MLRMPGSSTAEGLFQNTTLESLELQLLSDDDVLDIRPILDTLVTNNRLQKLGLCGERVSEESALALATILQHPMCNLQELSFTWRNE